MVQISSVKLWPCGLESLKPNQQQLGQACLIVVAACGVVMSLSTAVGIHFLFAPATLGRLKMDDMFEIEVLSGALNFAAPLGIVAGVAGVVLALRRASALLPISLLVVAFGAAMTCTLELWSYMAKQNGSNINLWANHIWWYIGK